MRQTFLLTAVGWLAVSLAAALPFAFSGLHLSPADAVFEAVSGVTTTGATVLRGLDRAPPGILLWRGLLQWLGGAGFLVMAVVVLPALNIAGMQIFRLETSGLGDRVTPRAATVAVRLIAIYAGLTIVLDHSLLGRRDDPLSRSPACHDGHFLRRILTADASIGGWRNPAVDWAALVGMVMGGAPFIIYLQLVQRRWQAALRNSQLRLYLTIMFGATLVITFWLIIEQNIKPLPALRHGAFTAASVMTGTGFATLDWGRWSGLPMAVLFFLTFVGGCAGSTAGGFKIFRLQILYANARRKWFVCCSRTPSCCPTTTGSPSPIRSPNSISRLPVRLHDDVRRRRPGTRHGGTGLLVIGVGGGGGLGQPRPRTDPASRAADRLRRRAGCGQMDPFGRHAVRSTGNVHSAGAVLPAVLETLVRPQPGTEG